MGICLNNNIPTEEYYGGLYPEPHEVIDDISDDFDIDEDEYHDLMMIGEIK